MNSPSLKQHLITCWQQRHLLYFLVQRDFRARYQHTLFGLFWIPLKPIFQVLVLTLVFHKIAHLSSGDVPYPLFVFAAIVPWQFFSSSLLEAAHIFRNNRALLAQVPFPRLLLPLSVVCAQLPELLIGLSLLVLCSLPFASALWVLPIAFLHLICLTLAAVLVITILSAHFDDVPLLLPFCLQALLFLSPVGYSAFLLGHRQLFVYALNPLVGIIEETRASVLGISSVHIALTTAASVTTTLLLLFLGWKLFARTEQSIGELL